MLTCQKLTEPVPDYVEGRMSLWKHMLVEMHLGTCKHCRAYLRQMRMTRKMLGEMPADTAQETRIPDDVRAELMQRFRDFGK